MTMKPARFPHLLIILFATTILLAFFLEGLPTRAGATAMTGTPLAATSLQSNPATQTPTETNTPDPVLIQQSHATDGITALSIIIVAVVLFGVLMGTRQQRKRRLPK
jgi:hypothetical protein